MILKHIAEHPDHYGILSTVLSVTFGFINPEVEAHIESWILIMRAVGITIGVVIGIISLYYKVKHGKKLHRE